jgi:hypothetical protein
MPTGIARAKHEGALQRWRYEDQRNAAMEQRSAAREAGQRASDMGALAIHARQVEAQQQRPGAGALQGAVPEQPTVAKERPSRPEGVPEFLDALQEQKLLQTIKRQDPALANIHRARIGAGGALIVQDQSGAEAILPPEKFAQLWLAAEQASFQPKTFSQKLAAERFALSKEKWEREKDVMDKREERLSKMISPSEKQVLTNAKDKLRLLIDQSQNVFNEEEQARLQARIAEAWNGYIGMMDRFDERHQGAIGDVQTKRTPAIVPPPEPAKTVEEQLRRERRQREAEGRARESEGQALSEQEQPIQPSGGAMQDQARQVAGQRYIRVKGMFAQKWNPANPDPGIKKTFDAEWRKTGLPESDAPHFKEMRDAVGKVASNKAAAPSERSKAKITASVMDQQARKDVEMKMSGLDSKDEIMARWRGGQLKDDEARELLLEIKQRAAK